MERAANISLAAWPGIRPTNRTTVSAKVFAAMLVASAGLSAALASWLPLQVSIVTVFLFAGPHNWFELRYFLMRLPARFGRSRNFFAVAFAGIFLLTIAYISLPALYYTNVWSGANWTDAIASWNTLLLLWVGALVILRGKQNSQRDWFWVLPTVFLLCALNWMAPKLFSLAIVYLHPLAAMWFLDRHLRRNRPEWLRTYHRGLILLPSADGRDDLATGTDVIAGGRQRIVLAHHATRRRGAASECIQPHAGLCPRISGDASLRGVDNRLAAHWDYRRSVECEDDPVGTSSGWVSEVNRRGSRLRRVCSRGAVVWIFS